MREELKANFDILLSEYPSGMAVNSLLIGKYFGIKQEYACVGNGAAELIKSLMESVEGNIGVVFPTFEEYPNRKTDRKSFHTSPLILIFLMPLPIWRTIIRIKTCLRYY